MLAYIWTEPPTGAQLPEDRSLELEIQKLFYQSYILQFMDYGSNTWVTASKRNIERLSKLQKLAAPMILSAALHKCSAN